MFANLLFLSDLFNEKYEIIYLYDIGKRHTRNLFKKIEKMYFLHNLVKILNLVCIKKNIFLNQIFIKIIVTKLKLTVSKKLLKTKKIL